MKLIVIEYERTVAHHVPDGMMDTRYSHSTVERTKMRLVAADDHPSTIAAAETYCDNRGGNRSDKAYKRFETRVAGNIEAILRPALTMLTSH